MNTRANETSTSRPAADSLAAGVPPWAWLLLGIAFTALAGNRFNVGLVGWVAAVPWLLHLRRTSGWKARGMMFLAMQVGMFLNILKIVTDPLPWFFALMFSVPMAISGYAAYVLFEAVRRRLGDRWGLVLFPSLVVVLEWLTYTGSEMGSWGAMAYTQLGNPAVMQMASLFGLTGVSVLLGAVSGLLAVLLDSPAPRRWWPAVVGVSAAVLLAHAYGAVRLDRTLDGPLVTVATVTSDHGPTPEVLADAALLTEMTDSLFARTAEAADQGAEVVVWAEGATAVLPDDEAALISRGAAAARAQGIDLVMAYVVLLDGMPRFDNKYVWFGPDGEVETYRKHHPVPGEGSIQGTDPLVAHDRPYGRAAGAICYDYDFPALGLEHAKLGADLVLVPSNDWRGIDPFHTQMALVRGIEGGFSVVRSVRFATSMAGDAMGRIRGSASWFEGERVMVTRVPAKRIETLYSRIGDALPLGAGIVLLFGIGLAVVRRVRGIEAPA